MATHSPGPWSVYAPANPLAEFTHAITTSTGAIAWVFPHLDDMALAEANAQLIASAPTMLAALKAAESIMRAYIPEDNFDGHAAKALKQVRAAIALANRS